MTWIELDFVVVLGFREALLLSFEVRLIRKQLALLVTLTCRLGYNLKAVASSLVGEAVLYFLIKDLWSLSLDVVVFVIFVLVTWHCLLLR